MAWGGAFGRAGECCLRSEGVVGFCGNSTRILLDSVPVYVGNNL
jgi:hypothetical protein